jgi:serine/threonine protein kinase
MSDSSPPPEQERRTLDISPDKRYKLLQRGQEHEAYDTLDGREVVWKNLSFDGLTEEQKSTLLLEAQHRCQLQHENLLPIFDHWNSPTANSICLITAKPTKSITKQIEDLKSMCFVLAPRLIKKFCRQILLALEYMHTREYPTPHRGLCSESIYVGGYSGDLLIEPMHDNIIDTLWTMETDIYAFGLWIFEIATHTKLNWSLNDLRVNAEKGEQPDVSKIEEEALRSFVRSCLAPPSQRPSAKTLLDQKAYPIDLDTLQSLQNSSISLQHNSPSASPTTTITIPPVGTTVAASSSSSSGTGSSSTASSSSESLMTRSYVDKSKRKVEPGHAQVIEVTVTPTESSTTLSLAIMCAFPTTNADGSWADVHKKKNISLGSYDLEKDDPLALAKEIVEHVPDFQKCENQAAMEGVVSAELSNMIAPFIAAWQSHRTMAESSLHEAAELADLEKKRVHNNYEGLVKVLQNELDFNPEWVNNFIEEQITLEDLLIIEEVDILKLVPRMGPRRRLLMYIQGMKEKAALATGAPSEAIPMEVTPQATLQTAQVEEHKEEIAETATNAEVEELHRASENTDGPEDEAHGPDDTDGGDGQEEEESIN